MTSTEPTWHLDLDNILRVLERDWEELSKVELSPVPDYSKEGVKTVFDALVRARGYGSRAAVLHSAAIRNLGESEAIYKAAEDSVNRQMDPVVVDRVAKLAGQGLSWKERESFYRLGAVAQYGYLRKLEIRMDRIRRLVEAVTLLAKDIERSRYDLNAIAEVMKFASALGEL